MLVGYFSLQTVSGQLIHKEKLQSVAEQRPPAMGVLGQGHATLRSLAGN